MENGDVAKTEHFFSFFPHNFFDAVSKLDLNLENITYLFLDLFLNKRL